MQTKPTDSTQLTAVREPAPPQSPVRNFARHYAEMLISMFAGMFGLGFAVEALLELAGVNASDWDRDLPALFLFSMAVYMTIPMVAWMRHRGHRWQLCWEMSAAMFVPTFAVMGLWWAGTSDSVHGLMGIQHAAMFPAMFLVMLLRRDEYTGGR